MRTGLSVSGNGPQNSAKKSLIEIFVCHSILDIYGWHPFGTHKHLKLKERKNYQINSNNAYMTKIVC